MAKEPEKGEEAASKGAGNEKTDSSAPARRFVIYNRTSDGVRKRNQRSPGGWLKSPGSFEFFVDGYRNLVSIADPEHLVDGHLKRVGVGGFESEKRIYVWSTHEKDPDGIEVKRYHDSVRINIAPFLAQIKLRPPVGVSDRFDLIEADADSPVQPALMFDLNKSLERKYFETTKKTKKEGSRQTKRARSNSKPDSEPTDDESEQA